MLQQSRTSIELEEMSVMSSYHSRSTLASTTSTTPLRKIRHADGRPRSKNIVAGPSTSDCDVLMPHEVFWRDHQAWLQQCGYMLRPRYKPNWVPSWRSSNADPRECEDGLALPVSSHSLLPSSSFCLIKFATGKPGYGRNSNVGWRSGRAETSQPSYIVT